MSTQDSGHSDGCYCHYLPDLVVVRPYDLAGAVSMSGSGWSLRPLENGELCRVLDGLDHEIIGVMQRHIGVLRVESSTGADPHDVVEALAAENVAASPVHGVGYMGHSGFQGSDWTDSDEVLKPVNDATEMGTIAVVDSGISSDLAPWVDDPNVVFERPIDIERLAVKNPVSHGTFVTSIIRRVAPKQKVSIASARPDPGHLISKQSDHEKAHKLVSPPTDELNVLGAVLRLIQRHRRDRSDLRVLNLSLGAHACRDTRDQFFLGLEAAVRAWRETFPEAEIVAAGGNSECTVEVYPAAFDGVKAVAAGREGVTEKARGSYGTIKVWAEGREIDAPERDWIIDVAPGCDIVGLSGQDEVHTIQWGGSSFAAAVVSALIGSGSYNPVSDDDKYWTPDRSLTYSAVPGLQP